MTDCRSPDGLTIGLLDAATAVLNVLDALGSLKDPSEEVKQALADLKATINAVVVPAAEPTPPRTLPE